MASTVITLIILLTVVEVANGQDITLTLPGDLNGEPGEQFSLDVEVSDLTGLDITNFDISLSFDNSLIELENSGIEDGALLSNQMQSNVTDDDRILVSYANSTPIEGEGTLFTINGIFSGEGESNDGLTVTELFFGDGSLDVSPAVPIEIAVKVEDVPGEVSLDFSGPVSGQSGESFTVEVEASDLSGLGVSNFDAEFSYDTSLLVIDEEGIEAGGLLDGPVTANVTDDGRMLVSYASSQDLEGAGTLFTVSGSLAGEGQNPQGLRVIDVLIGDGSLEVTPVFPVDITVEVEEVSGPIEWTLSPQSIDLPDASASSIDLVIEQTGGEDDLQWSLSTGAGWLSVDGEASGSGDAAITLIAGENETTSGREATILVSTNAGDRTVSVTQPGAEPPVQVTLDFGGSISGQSGELFTVEVEASDLSGLGVSNFDVEFSYDTSLLVIDEKGIEAGGLLDGPVTANVTDDGRMLISYASSQDLEGAGTLFTVSGSLAGEGQNPEGLRVIDVLIGDGSLEVTPAFPVDIAVEVKMSDEPNVITIKELNTYENLSSYESIPNHPLANEDVQLTAIISSYPKSSGLAFYDTDLETIGRVHFFITDTTALENGREGMSIQVVQGSETRAYESVESFMTGDVVTLTGQLTFFNETAQFMINDVITQLGNVYEENDNLEQFQPLLEPIELSPSNFHSLTGNDEIQLNLEAYQKYNGMYVRIEQAFTSHYDSVDVLRPVFSVTKDSVFVPIRDISLRYRNDRIDNYKTGFNYRREQEDGEFIRPSEGAIININGFLAVNNFITGDYSFTDGEGGFSISPMEDGILWIDENTRLENGVSHNGTFEWPIDFEVVLDQPKMVDLELPVNGATKIPTNTTLEWTEGMYAESYHLQISNGENFDELVLEDEEVSGQSFSTEDLDHNTTYQWRVRSVNSIGNSGWPEPYSFTTSMTTSVDLDEKPVEYELHQNYPNPFNPTTQIEYALPEQTHVTLEVYNMLGQRVSLMVNEVKNPGRYEVNFDASNLSSGLYLYRLQTNTYMETRQMMLIK